MVNVVAALIWKGEKFMICQRPEGKASFRAAAVNRSPAATVTVARFMFITLPVIFIPRDRQVCILTPDT